MVRRLLLRHAVCDIYLSNGCVKTPNVVQRRACETARALVRRCGPIDRDFSIYPSIEDKPKLGTTDPPSSVVPARGVCVRPCHSLVLADTYIEHVHANSDQLHDIFMHDSDRDSCHHIALDSQSFPSVEESGNNQEVVDVEINSFCRLFQSQSDGAAIQQVTDASTGRDREVLGGGVLPNPETLSSRSGSDRPFPSSIPANGVTETSISSSSFSSTNDHELSMHSVCSYVCTASPEVHDVEVTFVPVLDSNTHNGCNMYIQERGSNSRNEGQEFFMHEVIEISDDD